MKKFFFILFLLFLMWFGLRIIIPNPLFNTPTSTLLYAADGNLLGARIANDEQWRFPASDSIPKRFIDCLTSYEDKRFFYHPGVDPIALIRAIASNIQSKQIVSGGSTLTMQLARIARGNNKRNLYEKTIETIWALYLETIYSKKEILNLYASHAPFGGNIVGIEAASWRYFGRKSEDLSWAESATLAVLPNAPALIHPGRNRKKLKVKRDRLLGILLEKGILNKTDYELACLEPLPEKPLPLPNNAPHLLERLAQDYAGKSIQTSLQSNLQQNVQSIVNQFGYEYRLNHIHNLAAIVADVETGEVIAYAGNVTLQADERRGNHVDIITSNRSTGSLLKPFLFAGMLNDGLLLPETLIPDIPLNINGYMPQNFNKTFYGAVPAKEAIIRSLNVPLIRMLSSYNTERFMELLKQWGMTTLKYDSDHYGASLILGGAEGTLWDLSGMYASMARVLKHYRKYNGRYNPEDIHPLTPFPNKEQTPIQTINDKRLTDKFPLSYASLWFTIETLTSVNRPEEESDWQQFESMKTIAWKTGTSHGGRDAWAIGVTPRYVVGVWAGNASGEGRSGLTGVGNAGPVLFDIFSFLPNNEWFDIPYDELIKVPICNKSGHRASSACNQTDSVLIPISGKNTQLCPYHKIIHLSADGRFRVNSSCESINQMIHQSWFILPPAQEYYYKNHNLDYQPLPPIRPGCEGESEKTIEFIYPKHESVLFLPKGFKGYELFVFQAAHKRFDATLFWHLDNEYMGSTQEPHKISCKITPGKHILTLIDNDGNQKRIVFKVK